jgi:hypothetical protein
MGPDQWDLLAVEYNQKVHVPRDAESLRFKFKTLKNAKKPTGTKTHKKMIKARTVKRGHGDETLISCRSVKMIPGAFTWFE